MMKETYELFLQDSSGREWFVALTCEPQELMALARGAMAEQGAVLGDVRQFGRPMFSLGSPTTIG